MSSTSRGAQRIPLDYYATPPAMIRTFWKEFAKDEANFITVLGLPGHFALDPCAGGNKNAVEWEYKPGKTVVVPSSGMPYPKVLGELSPGVVVRTNDIRDDSPAQSHADFFAMPLPPYEAPSLVISNPPFAMALEFIEHALERVVAPHGWVVFLLRLNFMGSAKRFPLFQSNPPQRVYVHHQRPSFIPDGSTDSIEYAHFCWRRGSPKTDIIKLKVI